MQNTVTLNEKRGYSLEFLANQYCVSVAFLRKLERAGELRATRLGRRVIVLAEDWENYLNKEKNEK